MKFWDVDDDTSVGEYVTLTDNQAKEIYDFIQKNKGNKFIINCEMGYSRSAGVAIEWLLRDKFLCNKFSHFISNIMPHNRYDYNKTVFNKIVSFEK